LLHNRFRRPVDSYFRTSTCYFPIGRLTHPPSELSSAAIQIDISQSLQLTRKRYRSEEGACAAVTLTAKASPDGNALPTQVLDVHCQSEIQARLRHNESRGDKARNRVNIALIFPGQCLRAR